MSEYILKTGSKIYFNSVFMGLLKGKVTRIDTNDNDKYCPYRVHYIITSRNYADKRVHITRACTRIFPRECYVKTGMFRFVVLPFTIQPD